MAKIIPLYSGSSGNSYYIASSGGAILIDVGRSARQTAAVLEAAGVDPASIGGIFITHEHSDHIAGVRVFAEKYHIPVYAEEKTLEDLCRAGVIGPKTACGVIGATGRICAEMQVTPFETSHDTPQSCGYRIVLPDGRIVSLFTDLGTVTESVRDGLRGCDFAILESNHDPVLLQNGPYPYLLKQRILSARGHLSNPDCADEIAALALGGTARFLLAHLSRENNTPRIAFDCSNSALEGIGMKRGIDYELWVAPVYNEAGRGILF